MGIAGYPLDTQVGQTIRETEVSDVDQEAEVLQEIRSQD